MAEEKKLKLVSAPVVVQPRNYWNTSGKNREFFPTEPSPDSIPTFNKHGRVIAEPKNEWWVNSRDHHFCFWTYVKEKSQSDGTMEPLLQSDIAKLMGCSITKLHHMLKEAMATLTSEENLKILQGLEELSTPDPGEDSPYVTSVDEAAKEDDN